MRVVGGLLFGAIFACSLNSVMRAQGDEEKARSIPGGGIMVPGWKGQVDASAEKQGQSVQDDKLTKDGNALHMTTGPAVDFWKPENTANGNYTVSAKFSEPKFMNLNTHPHPYGVFIGGSEMGTPQQKMLYCAAYGNGTFIVRGFGPDPFQLGGRQAVANDAVHKAAKPGDPVEQTIALSVKGDSVSCAINGTVVVTYPKSEVVGPGKLTSTDGVYGLRSAHNTEVIVTDFKVIRD